MSTINPAIKALYASAFAVPNAAPAGPTTSEEAKKMATEIYDIGEGQFFGTDEQKFYDIINGVHQDYNKLVELDNAYREQYDHGLIVAAGIEMTGKDLHRVEDLFNPKDNGQFRYFNPTWQAEKIYNAGEGYRAPWLEWIGKLIPVGWQGTDEDRFYSLVKDMEGNYGYFAQTDQAYGKLFHPDQVIKIKDNNGNEAPLYTFGILRAAESEMSGEDLYRVEDIAAVHPLYTAQILHSAANADNGTRFYAKMENLDPYYLYNTNENYKLQFGKELSAVVNSEFKGSTKDKILEKLKTMAKPAAGQGIVPMAQATPTGAPGATQPPTQPQVNISAQGPSPVGAGLADVAGVAQGVMAQTAPGQAQPAQTAPANAAPANQGNQAQTQMAQQAPAQPQPPAQQPAATPSQTPAQAIPIPEAPTTQQNFTFYFDSSNAPSDALVQDVQGGISLFNIPPDTVDIVLDTNLTGVSVEFGNNRSEIYFDNNLADNQPLFFVQTSQLNNGTWKEIDIAINNKIFDERILGREDFHDYFQSEVSTTLTETLFPEPPNS